MKPINSDLLCIYCSESRRDDLDSSCKPWRPWCVDVIDESPTATGIVYRYTASGRRAAYALADELQRLNKNKLKLDIKPLTHKVWKK